MNTVEIIHKGIGTGAFKPTRTLNAAVLDSVMVGIARRLQKGKINNLAVLQSKYRELLQNPEYASAVEVGTASPENVKQRLGIATEYFSSVP